MARAIHGYTGAQLQRRQTPCEHILHECFARNKQYEECAGFSHTVLKHRGTVGVQGNGDAPLFSQPNVMPLLWLQKDEDCLSAITAVHYRNAAQPIIGELIHSAVTAKAQGHKISRNERAATCATQASNGTIKQVSIRHRDCKLTAQWQSSQGNETNNKLHMVVKPFVAEWESSKNVEPRALKSSTPDVRRLFIAASVPCQV